MNKTIICTDYIYETRITNCHIRFYCFAFPKTLHSVLAFEDVCSVFFTIWTHLTTRLQVKTSIMKI